MTRKRELFVLWVLSVAAAGVTGAVLQAMAAPPILMSVLPLFVAYLVATFLARWLELLPRDSWRWTAIVTVGVLGFLVLTGHWR